MSGAASMYIQLDFIVIDPKGGNISSWEYFGPGSAQQLQQFGDLVEAAARKGWRNRWHGVRIGIFYPPTPPEKSQPLPSQNFDAKAFVADRRKKLLKAAN